MAGYSLNVTESDAFDKVSPTRLRKSAYNSLESYYHSPVLSYPYRASLSFTTPAIFLPQGKY
jgi:hypothetical protein